jgi:two-component system CheB/CheR fusion protein
MGETAGTVPLRVLVVDDCVDTAESLAALLGLWGYRAVVAHDGGTALVAALAHQPEVILLDLALPGLDGLEVARRLRRQQDLREALLVAVTGYGDEACRRRADEAGFDLYLLKPLDLDWLQRLLALRQEERGGAAADR